MDRRALFFLVAACAAALIAPVTDEDLRYVPEILAAVYVLLAIASYLDWRTNKR